MRMQATPRRCSSRSGRASNAPRGGAGGPGHRWGAPAAADAPVRTNRLLMRADSAGRPRATRQGSRPPLGSPLYAPLGARVRAVGRVCSCAGDDYPPNAPPRSSATMRPVGPLAGLPCELVARHAVEGLHWMPLSATTRGGSRCHALLQVSN